MLTGDWRCSPDRGKILKEIATVKERPAKIRELAAQVDAISMASDLVRLERMLPELERILLMPLKPPPAQRPHDSSGALHRGLICSSCLSPSPMSMPSCCHGCYPPISPRSPLGGYTLASSRHNSGVCIHLYSIPLAQLVS